MVVRPPEPMIHKEQRIKPGSFLSNDSTYFLTLTNYLRCGSLKSLENSTNIPGLTEKPKTPLRDTMEYLEKEEWQEKTTL